MSLIKKFRISYSIVIIFFSFYICCEDIKGQNQEMEISQLLGDWVLINIIEKPDNRKIMYPNDQEKMVVIFYDTSVVIINSLCNKGQGFYYISGSGKIKIEKLNTSLKYCLNDSINIWEDILINTIKASENYSVNKDNLNITTSVRYDLNLIRRVK